MNFYRTLGEIETDDKTTIKLVVGNQYFYAHGANCGWLDVEDDVFVFVLSDHIVMEINIQGIKHLTIDEHYNGTLFITIFVKGEEDKDTAN